MINSRKTNGQLERSGVHRIASVFCEHFDWIFREQSVEDFGIDATVEETVNGTPTGKLIALQIKSGDSHFHKSKASGKITFYFEKKHFDYWINYSLPVILVGYLPKDNLLLWQLINERTTVKGSKGYKIEMEYKLDISERENLQALFYPLFLPKIQEIGKSNYSKVWIEEIKMAVNDENSPLEYKYPIIKSENKYLEQSINHQIREKIFESLEIRYSDLSIVDTFNVLSALKDYYLMHFNGGIMFLEYELFRNDNKILSFSITCTSVTAHPIYYRNYFCFDLKTGNQLSIKQMISPFKMEQFVFELSNAKKERYENSIKSIKEESHNVNMKEIEVDYYLEMGKEDLDRFRITENQIQFDFEYGFPFAIKALEPDGIFSYNIEEMKDILNPYILSDNNQG
jgi:hypothetical protein